MQQVSGLIEYNSLSTLVAATATSPDLFSRFFKPHQCSRSSTLMIGRSERQVALAMSPTRLSPYAGEAATGCGRGCTRM